MSFTAQLGTVRSVPGQLLLGFSGEIPASALSELSVSHKCSCVVDFLTAFDKVIPLLGFTPDTQGPAALIHALLQYAARHSNRNGPYASPCEEVIARFELADVNKHAIRYLREFMNTAADQYNRR